MLDNPKELMSRVAKGLVSKGMTKATPDVEVDVEEDDSDSHLQEIADDLINAISDKDKKAVADLLREAFDFIKSSSDEDSEDEE